MKNTENKPRKIRTTLALTKQAQDIIFDFGYASERPQGEFISGLIVAHHARQTRKLTQVEIIQELARLVDLLAQIVVDIDEATEHSPTKE